MPTIPKWRNGIWLKCMMVRTQYCPPRLSLLRFCIATRRSKISATVSESPVPTSRPVLSVTGKKIPSLKRLLGYILYVSITLPTFSALELDLLSFIPRPTLISAWEFLDERFHSINTTGRCINFMERMATEYMSVGYLLCSVSDVSRVYDHTFHIPPSASRISAINCAIIGKSQLMTYRL